MGNLAFRPVRLGASLLAGLLAKRLFGLVWNLIDEAEAPQAEHRSVHVGKLVLALAIEGAVFSVVKGLVDHGSRHAFATLAGSWPGEEESAGDDGEPAKKRE